MKPTLDIESPRGQQSLVEERRMLAAIRLYLPGFRIIETDKSKPDDVDGYLIKQGRVRGVFESKCRHMTRETLRGPFQNEWLVTTDKLVRGVAEAKKYDAPFFGFLYLVPDDVALAIRLADEDGQFLPPMREQWTLTQATCNGGQIERLNTYVDMSLATTISMNWADLQERK